MEKEKQEGKKERIKMKITGKIKDIEREEKIEKGNGKNVDE
jgi:hypothetical protein